MKHLSQQMLSMELRRPFLDRHRQYLREVLRRPGLSAGERLRLSQELTTAGSPKDYDTEPQPGAVDPGPMPVTPIAIDLAEATHDSLATLSHARLFLFATQQNIDVRHGNTKAQVIEAILGSVQGETP